MAPRTLALALAVPGAVALLGPVLWATLFSRAARHRRRWRGYLRRLPNLSETGTWVREGYVGFEDGSKAGGWGGCEGGYHPFPCPMTLGETALHLHPWPAAHVPAEGRLARLKALSVPWAQLRPGADRFTWVLSEEPRLVLHLAADGARALDRRLAREDA